MSAIRARGLEIGPVVQPYALAAFFHSKRYFVLVGLAYRSAFVNQCKVTMFQIVREGDLVSVGPHTFTFRELTTETLHADSELVVSRKRCLVDGLPFRSNDKVVFCPSCNTPHHERCWQFQKGRCANGSICQYQAPWDELEVKVP